MMYPRNSKDSNLDPSETDLKRFDDPGHNLRSSVD